MTLETQVLYDFGSFRLDPSQRSLLCEGKPVSLTPKSFEILVVLIQNSGRVLTKDDLMKKVWPDSFVEEANLTVNISALRKALGESTGSPQFIETVTKLGYRFIAPVTEVKNEPRDTPKLNDTVQNARTPKTVPAVSLSTPSTSGPLSYRHAPARRMSVAGPGILVLAVVLVALAMVAYWLNHKQVSGLPVNQPHRLAILPFRNIRQDTASDFLGYSLADAVITKLGYVNSLRVRPSYSIEKYRNQVIDIQKVAADLDVDALLTGSFMRDGDDLRITCQLVEVKTENILWKGAFDLRYEKLLTVQDQVAEQIIHGLELNLSSTEAEGLKLDQPANALGYEYYLRGIDLYARSDFPLAIRMLEKSAEIDPNYALTWAYLGRSYNANGSFQMGGREYYKKAQAAFEKALALRPAQIETRVYIANFLTDTGKVEQAVPLLRESLKTNPNHAELHWELGYAYRFAGMLKESVAECEQARQFDPGVKINSSALNSYLYLGEYDKFLAALPRSRELPFHFFYRGFGEYYKEQSEQAAEDFDRAFNLNPQLFQARVGKALSDSLKQQKAKGLEIVREAEKTMEDRGVADSEGIYKLAQAYAVLGDRASALRVLRHSIENGFFAYPYFVTDPLLDSLRHEPEFAKLLDAARERHEKFRKTFF